MSDLHYDLNKRYGSYKMELSTLMHQDITHFLFDVVVNNELLMSGSQKVLCAYDPTVNVLAWADVSNTLDKVAQSETRKIRETLSDSNITQASADLRAMSTDNFYQLLAKVSETLKKDVLLDNRDKIIHVYVVDRIFYDNRKTT